MNGIYSVTGQQSTSAMSGLKRVGGATANYRYEVIQVTRWGDIFSLLSRQ